MKQLIAGPCALAFLSLVFSPLPAQAQTEAIAATPSAPFRYDVEQEMTFSGTVSSVLAKPFAGMIASSHLLLNNSSGSLDISLGTFALRGKDAFAMVQGQQIEVVGVKKMLKDGQVILARSVKAGNHVYVIRNMHGIPVSPQTRRRTNQKIQDGETL